MNYIIIIVIVYSYHISIGLCILESVAVPELLAVDLDFECGSK